MRAAMRVPLGTCADKVVDRLAKATGSAPLAALDGATLLCDGLLLLHGAAYARGFDCDKAATAVEHAICRDKAIGDLDVVLAQQLKTSSSVAGAIANVS